MGLYNKRYLAFFVIEATTPLSIGSGKANALTTSSVVRDINNLPYIPGTTLAGILRHSLTDGVSEAEEEDSIKDIWGHQEPKKGDENKKINVGSKIIFTDAKLINHHSGEVCDGYLTKDVDKKLIEEYRILPIRQHAKIDAKGATEKGGKFDEEVVYKGARFAFEIEYLSTDEESNTEDEKYFKKLCAKIIDSQLRIGSGSRNGLGEIKVISSRSRSIDMMNPEDRKSYLEKSSKLDINNDFYKDVKDVKDVDSQSEKDKGHKKYTLGLTPDNFFFFGSGLGNEEVDSAPVSEQVISWSEGNGENVKKGKDKEKGETGKLTTIEDADILIPASSVKGAISHRVAYHYNRIKEKFADQIEEKKILNFIGSNNLAVRCLFGSEGKDNSLKLRGNVISSDVFLDKGAKRINKKLFNHVAIDRFDGSAKDGALYNEEVNYFLGNDKDEKESFNLTFDVDLNGITSNLKETKEKIDIEAEKKNILEAFKAALTDICNGMLPLGGATNRGHGCFQGELKESEENESK